MLKTVAECLDCIVVQIARGRPIKGQSIAGPEILCDKPPVPVPWKRWDGQCPLTGLLPATEKGLDDEKPQSEGKHIELTTTHHSFLRFVIKARKDSVLPKSATKTGKPHLGTPRDFKATGEFFSNGRAKKRISLSLHMIENNGGLKGKGRDRSKVSRG